MNDDTQLTYYLDKKIIFFDGVCDMCHASVQYVLSKNPKKNIYFSSLQSSFAKRFFQHSAVELCNDSVVFYNNGHFSNESNALFEISKHLTGFLSKLIQVGSILPRFLTNPIYRFVSNHRSWFTSNKAKCILPNESELSRLIDEKSI